MSAPALRRRRHAPASESLTTYLHELRDYPLLSRSEEAAVARQIRTGDADALRHLVCANLRFVVSVAKKYQHQGVLFGDLINEGNLGLLRAAEKFDDAKGVRFISYAVWWIRQAILQALAEHAHTVRVPLSRAGMLYRMGRHANVLRHELGREPTPEEIIAGLDISEEDAASNIPITRSYLSLDAPVAGSDDANLLDYLPDESAARPDVDVLDRNLTETVGAALAQLRPREALVLRLHFGIGQEDPMTLESIGALLGITRERVRQIKEKALSRLRHAPDRRMLASLRDR